jgi:hypothetical protein
MYRLGVTTSPPHRSFKNIECALGCPNHVFGVAVDALAGSVVSAEMCEQRDFSAGLERYSFDGLVRAPILVYGLGFGI